MEKEIKVGDRVKVIDDGKEYTSYKRWIEDFAPKYLNKYHPYSIKEGEQGTVAAVHKHHTYTDIIALVKNGNDVALFKVGGLEKIAEEKPTGGNFKVRCTHGVIPGTFFTTGKIYEIKDGEITLDGGLRHFGLNNIKDLKKRYASEFELVKDKPTIVIYPQGTDTIAILKEGKKVVKTAKAKYNPNDEKEGLPYKFEIGAELAMKRLLGKEDIEPKTSFDWELFKARKITVHCDTEEKAKEFLKECYEQGINWCGDRKLTLRTYWDVYEKETVYGISLFGGGLSYGTQSSFSNSKIIDYQPSEPEVREVKRQAKVGEWIKIVSLVNTPEAANGKKGKVLGVDEDGRIYAEHEKIWKYSGESRPGYEITNFHQSMKYVVLENYKGDF